MSQLRQEDVAAAYRLAAAAVMFYPLIAIGVAILTIVYRDTEPD